MYSSISLRSSRARSVQTLEPPGDAARLFRRVIARYYRNAEELLRTALPWLTQYVASLRPEPQDVLDPIASKRTREEVEASASPISRQWGILTGVQPRDFAEALRAAVADR